MHSKIIINSIKKSVEGYLYDYLKKQNGTIEYAPDTSKTLSQQTLITAHNSMSNTFFKNVPFLNKILNSQDLSITNLLKAGIRGIDLDVYNNNNMMPLHSANS